VVGLITSVISDSFMASQQREQKSKDRDPRTVLDTVPKDVGILGVRRRLMIWLVVTGTMEFNVHSVGNFIIPTDKLIFFRGVETTNQNMSELCECM
jgi:hypothetical protein